MRKYFDTVLIGNPARPAPGALVYVYITDTDQETLATLYGIDGAEADNPVVADDQGYYEFYIDSGSYDLQFFFLGEVRETITDVQIDDGTIAAICQLYNNGSISLATSGVEQNITWASETQDPLGMHSGTGANVTVLVAGVYAINFNAVFAANATGTRTVQIQKNTVTINGAAFIQPGNATNQSFVNGTAYVSCVVGDVLRLQAIQTSGGALNLDLSYVSVLRIGG